MEESKLLKLNIQFFADENTDETENVETTENTQEEKQDNTTFTQSDVDRQISKAVESALKNGRAKWEEEKQKEIEQAKNEAEEYAKMSQKEKEDAEYQKRIDALEKREKELNDRQLLSEIETDLKDNKLPASFAQSLLAIQDNEKIKQAITDIKKDFDEAVNAQVKEALRQETPDESTAELTNNPIQAKLAKYQK